MLKLQLLAIAGAGRLLLHCGELCAKQGTSEALLMPLVAASQDINLQHADIQRCLHMFFAAGPQLPCMPLGAAVQDSLGCGLVHKHDVTVAGGPTCTGDEQAPQRRPGERNRVADLLRLPGRLPHGKQRLRIPAALVMTGMQWRLQQI